MIALVLAIILHFMLRKKPFTDASLELKVEEKIENQIWKDQIWISSI